jgi:hypothetical protein
MPAKTNSTRSKASAKLPPKAQELLHQCLETELAGVEVYRTALQCVRDERLRDEWTRYLAQTERHVERTRELCRHYGLDVERETPGREVVRHLGSSLVGAMRMALSSSSGEDAELVAAECVALAETKDHQNWELLGRLVDAGEIEDLDALEDACRAIEEEEHEHVEHALGWARELWAAALDLEADLPPPEAEDDVLAADEELAPPPAPSTRRAAHER